MNPGGRLIQKVRERVGRQCLPTLPDLPKSNSPVGETHGPKLRKAAQRVMKQTRARCAPYEGYGGSPRIRSYLQRIHCKFIALQSLG